jgi:hypothetical protein
LPAGADAVPAIASTNSDLQPGDRGVFSFGDKYLTFQVVRVSDSLPLVNSGGDRFLVVAQDHLATLAPVLGGAASADFIAAPASASDAIKSAAAQPSETSNSPASREAAATLAATPVSQAVERRLWPLPPSPRPPTRH